MDPRCEILILMGKTDPQAEVHSQQSMVLVPMNTPGVTIERNLTVFGYTEQPGHAEVSFTDVRVPAATCWRRRVWASPSRRPRLGPGRVHHCMRAIGMAERALDMMCDRPWNGWPSTGRWLRRVLCANGSPARAWRSIRHACSSCTLRG